MQDIEFLLTPKQTVAIGEKLPEHDILVGSIQRRKYPEEPVFYFRGKWMTGQQAERLRSAAKKIKTRKSKS
jgi:hypothetical protein